MKNKCFVFIGFLFSLFCIQSVHADNPNQVNFLNWAEYINPSVVPAFEKQSGITVNQSFFDGSDMLKAKLMAGGQGYDLTVPALSDMIQELPAGVFQKLDKSKIPNYKYRDPKIYAIATKVDPGNQYGIVYMYGTTGISYNPVLVKEALGADAPVDQWKILFDPKYLSKLQGCGVAFLDEPVQVFGLTMYYLGKDPNSTNPADYYAAADYLMKIRKYLIYFDNNRYITDLAAGNICIAMGYSGDTMRAEANAMDMHAAIQVNYSLPSTGAPIWFDMLAIPKNAPHVAATLAFINYLMDPKVAAENSNYLYQPSAIIGVSKYYNHLLTSTPGMLPDDDTTSHLFNIHIPPPAINDLETRLWMEVKYGIY